MNQKKLEQTSLLAGIAVYLFLSVVSFLVYAVSGLEAMFLDASFTLITAVSTLMAILISKCSNKVSQRYPYGLFILEPLYAIVKSLLIVFITIVSCIKVSRSAANYFLSGKGQVIRVGPIIPYAILAVICCTILYFFYTRQNARMNNTSTILKAEANSALLDGLMCAGIGVLAILVSLIKKNSPMHFLLYTGDFFVTVGLSLAVIKQPFLIIKQSFRELANSILDDQKLKNEMREIIFSHLPPEVDQYGYCLIIKVGMSFRVRFILSEMDKVSDLNAFIQCVSCAEQALSEKYGYVQTEFVFS